MALHPGPDGHCVVGDVFLIDVTVAREELRGAGHELTDRQIGEPETDERLNPGALLGVHVDVREVSRIAERHAADVVVGDRLDP